MKTILPISIATLFLFAPTFHYIQGLAPNKNAPSIPFHTAAFSDGKSLPSHITTTTTVGPEDGVILVNTVVDIHKDATLVLKPGTTVAVAEYAGLRIFGSLNAIGTEKLPIQFISNELNETNRNWNGLLFERDSSGHIEHVVFHHASPAISCASSENVILNNITSLFGNLDLWGSC